MAKGKTNAARGQPPHAALFRGSLKLSSRRLGRRDDGTSPTALASECHIYQYWLHARRFGESQFTQPLRRLAFQPVPRTGSGGGRNARATGTHSRAFPISPGNSPSRIASCHRRHRNHQLASFENATFSLNPLSATLLLLATQKPSPLVQNLWTMCLPCGSPRKSKN